jgi:hypothetical protein
METKHTKVGLLYTKNPGSIVVHDYEMYAICDIWYDESNEDEALANAKLIVVAPELLKKLIELRDSEHINITGNDWTELDLLIKKATE